MTRMGFSSKIRGIWDAWVSHWGVNFVQPHRPPLRRQCSSLCQYFHHISHCFYGQCLDWPVLFRCSKRKYLCTATLGCANLGILPTREKKHIYKHVYSGLSEQTGELNGYINQETIGMSLWTTRSRQTEHPYMELVSTQRQPGPLPKSLFD